VFFSYKQQKKSPKIIRLGRGVGWEIFYACC